MQEDADQCARPQDSEWSHQEDHSRFGPLFLAHHLDEPMRLQRASGCMWRLVDDLLNLATGAAFGTRGAVMLHLAFGDAAAWAQRHREPRSLLETAALTTTDFAAEADDRGLVPGQVRIIAGVSLPGGTP
jgi:hypothetical protein